MDKFLGQIKAVAGAVVGFAVYVISTVEAGGAIIPSVDPFDKWGWAWFVGSAVLGYLGVYGAPQNKLPPVKLAKQLDALPAPKQDAVIDAVQSPLPTEETLEGSLRRLGDAP